MQWSEFYPYVLPYVLGCPLPVVDHHVRQAAIEFCKRTACWQKTLEPVLVNGVDNLVELEFDTGTQIIRVKNVAVDGLTHPMIDSANGLALVRADSTLDFCFTQDNKTLYISPLPASGISVTVEAVMAPSRTATTIDDVIGNDYLQDIAHGAVASILRLPQQPFTDANTAMAEQALYERRISTIASKVARGFMPAKMPSYGGFL